MLFIFLLHEQKKNETKRKFAGSRYGAGTYSFIEINVASLVKDMKENTHSNERSNVKSKIPASLFER